MLKQLNLLIVIATIGMIVSCSQSKKADQSEETTTVVEEVAGPNELTASEAEDGWKLLFDGTTSEGWRGYGQEDFPAGWEIVDGMLYMAGSGRGEAGSEEGGDIIYNQEFENFHLKLSWKLSEGGNSGIFYLGQESPEYEDIWQTAPEMQILDNDKHIDANLGKDGNRQAGSLYDLIPAKPQNARPIGEWNDIEIIVYNGTVVHKQNGETVLEYHLWTPKWDEMIAGSKFPEYNENWHKVASKGYFGLQDHGDDVWFKDIKIKEL